MFKTCIQFIIALLCTGLLNISCADNKATQQLIQKLTPYQQTQGAFMQQIMDDKGLIIQQTQGRFALNRSMSGEQTGRFRWETTKPMAQLLIADGEKIYFYDPALQQATVQKQQTAAMKNSPAMLLSGSLSQISANYNVSMALNNEGEIFTLTPKKSSFFHSLKIQFRKNANQFILSKMIVTDNLDQKTQIQFSDLSEGIEPALFHFVAPKGTDIINA